MAKVRKKLDIGVKLKPTDLTVNTHSSDGEMSVDSNDNKLKIRLNAADRSVVTENQTQTLTNKSIDADNNTVSNLETDNLKSGVLNTDTGLSGASNTQIPSALAVKTYIDNGLAGQNEASEIAYDPTGNVEVLGSNLQTALDDVDAALQTKALASDLTNHLNDAVDAHDASAISNVPSGNLAATDLQGAVNELQSDIDTRALANNGTITNASIQTPTRLDVKQDTLANLETYALTATNGQLVFATDELKMFQIIANELQPVGGAGGTTIEIDQVAHGLSVGNGIYHNGTSWVKGQANSGATLATFVVTEVPDVDSFVAYQFGRVEVPAHGFTVGQYYFLSNSVLGQPTSTEPTTDYSNPLFFVESANFLQVMVYRPSVVGEQTPLNDLADVDVSASEDKQFLQKNGSTWNGAFVQEQVVTITANEPMAIRTAVYISSIGQVNKLDCTDDAKIEFIGFTREATAGAAPVDIVISGKLGGFSGLTAGEFVYADPSTPGNYVQPKPTQTNTYQIILGKAISATEILVLPDLAASAEFNREVTISGATITNNQASPTAVTGAIFDGFRAAIINYSIYRSTDSNEASQVGQLRLSYKTTANTWSLSDDFSGDDAGVTFSIDVTGQLLYTSSNLAGTGYVSKLQLDIKNLFEV
jgi:hypothetical protein